MNATQRAKKKARAAHFALERERMKHLSLSDSSTIRHASKDVLSKASAKRGKLERKAAYEVAVYQSGYKGDAIATGKDEQGRFRVRDLPFRVSQKAWMRRNP
jgi:hypothetical protein